MTPDQLQKIREQQRELSNSPTYEQEEDNNEMSSSESFAWFMVQLIVGLIVCVILSGMAAVIAERILR